MDNIAGSPVEGDNFFGRTDDIENLKETLRHHDILLLGARRIGKTSIARAVMAAVQNEQWRAIEINVASCADEACFLRKLETALRNELSSVASMKWEAFKDRLSSLTERVKSVKIPIPGAGSVGIDIKDAVAEEWTVVADEVLTLIAQPEERWMIYVDELPILLFNIIRQDPASGIFRVRRFLDWFRNDVRGLPGNNRVRWLVSGSVGLDTLVQQHGMADTINSLKHVTLPPFGESTAIEMLMELAKKYSLQFEESDAKTLLAAVHWLQPYYIQLAFSNLRLLLAKQSAIELAEATKQAVDKMTQPGLDNEFHHWERRLSIQLPQVQAMHAIALLVQASETREGASAHMLLATLHGRLPDATSDEARELFISLRDILQRDAYWEPHGEGNERRYRFMLEPLRRWWQRRNSL